MTTPCSQIHGDRHVVTSAYRLLCGAWRNPQRIDCRVYAWVLCIAQGAQPLYWGATEEGQLLLGSHLDELEGCNPTATMFPPGACGVYAATHTAGQQHVVDICIAVMMYA